MKFFAMFLVVMSVFFSCERNINPVNDELGVTDKDVEKEDDFTGNDSDATDDSSGISDDEVQDFDETPIPLRNVTTEGSYGRIKISFEMDFADDVDRKTTVFFQGGCNGEISEQALILEDISSLKNGTHTVTWPSWDQQAGCAGPTKIIIAVDPVTAESEIFELENIDENSGFASLPKEDQGMEKIQEHLYKRALKVLLEDPAVDFVATRLDDDTYEVRAERGYIVFKRVKHHRGYIYDIVSQNGENPIGNQDGTAFPTYLEELAAGGNPEQSSCDEYSSNDARMSFPEPEEDSYPFGYQRLTAYFDHPDSSDFIVNPKGYVHYEKGHAGNHGSLNMIQSRCPFLIWGKGVLNTEIERPLRMVDIAPTVAELMGMPDIEGIDERGIISAFNKLKWQDGSVINDILTGEKAEHVLILVADGANMTQVYNLMEKYPNDFPNFNKMKNEGAWAKYGSITNFPSNTYPSHNVLGSGVFSGHHGLIDNSYYMREAKKLAKPIAETAYTEKYFNPVYGEAESLHMAVHRVFGVWEDGISDGGYTMSIFDPSVKDSDTSDIELRDRSGKIVSFNTILPSLDTPLPNLPVSEYTLLAVQQTEGVGLSQLEILFGSGPNPMPKYVIMNMMTSDSAGHEKGPHGDLMKKVYEHIDKNIGVIFKWLGKWGILDKTVIIFTSDHGMQMGDPKRFRNFKDSLDNEGIPYIKETGNGIYFNQN